MGELDEIQSSVARGTQILGVGPALVVASVAAASLGLACGVVRTVTKVHGIPRPIDGAYEHGRPTTVFCTTPRDRSLVDALGVDVAACVHVPVLERPRWTRLPELNAPFRLNGSLESYAEARTDGPFVRSSGEQADFYFDTLPAAFCFEVAAAFAEECTATPWDVALGVRWGGVYLAAVIALRMGGAFGMVDPLFASADAQDRCFDAGLRLAVVDDLVNSAAAIDRSDALAQKAGARSTDLLALYSLGRQAGGRTRIRVGAALDLPLDKNVSNPREER